MRNWKFTGSTKAAQNNDYDYDYDHDRRRIPETSDMRRSVFDIDFTAGGHDHVMGTPGCSTDVSRGRFLRVRSADSPEPWRDSATGRRTVTTKKQGRKSPLNPQNRPPFSVNLLRAAACSGDRRPTEFWTERPIARYPPIGSKSKFLSVTRRGILKWP